MTKHETRTLIFAHLFFIEMLKYSGDINLSPQIVSMLLRLSTKDHNPVPEITKDFQERFVKLLSIQGNRKVRAFSLWSKCCTKLDTMLRLLNVQRNERREIIKAAKKIKPPKAIARDVGEFSKLLSLLEGEYDFEVS